MKHQRVYVPLEEGRRLQPGTIVETSHLGGAQPEFEEVSILRETLASLKQRWRGLTLWVFFCVAAAVAYVLLATPQFVATTQVVLQPRQPAAPLDTAESSTASTLDSAQADSQVQVIQSERNLRFVFVTLDLADDPDFANNGFDPIGWIQSLLPFGLDAAPMSPGDKARRAKELAYNTFADCVRVKRLAQSYAFEISFRALSSRKAARLANSVTAAYIRDQVIYNVAATEAQRGSDYLLNRISVSKTDQEVATNAVKTGVIPDYTFGHADARIVSAALEPLTNSYPMTTLILALAAFFGAASGVGAIIMQEGLDRTIRSREQLRRLSGIFALDVLPRISRKRLRCGSASLHETLDAPASEFAKVMHRLRTSVLTKTAGSQHVSVGIVSCGAGEGRSIVAANLAYAIAASGHLTTLLDADIRNPTLTKALTPQAVSGLAELMKNRDVDATGLQLPINSTLSFIPAAHVGGDYDANLFIGSRETLDAVMGLSAGRELIVDLPPMSVSADAIALGRSLTGVIVVAALRRTTLDELANLLRTLLDNDVRVLDVLLNEAVAK